MANIKVDTKLTDIIVDVDELGRPSVYALIGDMWAIDKIATLLGTSDEWRGADFLEYIAEVIGMVRPHPAGPGGHADGNAYATAFLGYTNRKVHPDFDQRKR